MHLRDCISEIASPRVYLSFLDTCQVSEADIAEHYDKLQGMGYARRHALLEAQSRKGFSGSEAEQEIHSDIHLGRYTQHADQGGRRGAGLGFGVS